MGKMTWRQTWPDRENDGTGTTDDRPDLKARVYLEPSGKQWYWVVNSWRHLSSGLEPTKEAAKAAAQDLVDQVTTNDDQI